MIYHLYRSKVVTGISEYMYYMMTDVLHDEKCYYNWYFAGVVVMLCYVKKYCNDLLTNYVLTITKTPSYILRILCVTCDNFNSFIGGVLFV